jgi:hypothetical protein
MNAALNKMTTHDESNPNCQCTSMYKVAEGRAFRSKLTRRLFVQDEYFLCKSDFLCKAYST